ncbi:MAG: hypothetical protein HY361_02425 [Candidatus Aenigmarchaeota archaeon]|nr:hypothetical protein [Candidatus Aenigmarchaeota archaeon]
MKEFILVFDLPREMGATKVKTWRELQKIDAKMIQFSIWKSEKLQDLIDIATFIKKSGGIARILEDRFVF